MIDVGHELAPADQIPMERMKLFAELMAPRFKLEEQGGVRRTAEEIERDIRSSIAFTLYLKQIQQQEQGAYHDSYEDGYDEWDNAQPEGRDTREVYEHENVLMDEFMDDQAVLSQARACVEPKPGILTSSVNKVVGLLDYKNRRKERYASTHPDPRRDMAQEYVLLEKYYVYLQNLPESSRESVIDESMRRTERALERRKKFLEIDQVWDYLTRKDEEGEERTGPGVGIAFARDIAEARQLKNRPSPGKKLWQKIGRWFRE